MRYSSKTSIGLVRKHNEDSYCINEDINLFAVADGMGGHKAGEVASSIAVKTLEEILLQQTDRLAIDASAALEQAILTANKNIYETAKENDQQKGMGTTITAALVTGKYLYLAHVGDSRAFLIHKRSIKQVTQDHSLVNELIRNGDITEEQASHHPQKNVLTRALGTSPKVVIDFYQEKVAKGDTLILCSDGLSNLVDRDEIMEIVWAAGDIDTSAELLVDKAIDRGGFDNITVVICQV